MIYENSLIQHIDRPVKESDISKVFIDNFILSQKTKMLFISLYFNFGRVAALSCKYNNIYDSHGNIINKKNYYQNMKCFFETLIIVKSTY